MATLMRWFDLRFKSQTHEKDFKKNAEEKLIFSGLCVLFVWHTLLLMPALRYGSVGLLHVLLLVSTCLLGSLALLRLRIKWFRSFNWEFILLFWGSLTMLLYPLIRDDYLNRLPNYAAKDRYFENLGILLGISHAIAVPFRATFSWVLLLSDFVACLMTLVCMSKTGSFDDVVCSTMVAGTCVLCWWKGRQLEEKTRWQWQSSHASASKLSSVLPEENPDVPLDDDDGAAITSAKPSLVVNDPTEIELSRRHPLRIGSIIPDFHLTTTRGDFLLSEFLQRDDAQFPFTLLFSHPADFTPACTTELGTCQRLGPQFSKAGVKMIGLSCDSIAEHHEWSKDVLATDGSSSSSGLNFPIIADVERTIVEALGLLDPYEKDPRGNPLPSRAMVLLHHNIVKLTSLYPASCARNFNNIEKIISSLKIFRMGSSLPTAPNPLALTATIPDFVMTTTHGEYMMHEWLLAKGTCPWTLFMSFSGRQDSARWTALLDVAAKLPTKVIGIMTGLETADALDCGFPVILDHDRKVSTMLDILDTNLKDESGLPQLACTLVILCGTTVRFSEMNQASVPRNFDEVARILSSFMITDNNAGLVTPANWEVGQPVLLHPSMSAEEAKRKHNGEIRTINLPSGKDYLRTIDCPIPRSMNN